jgi:hypothetical protein
MSAGEIASPALDYRKSARAQKLEPNLAEALNRTRGWNCCRQGLSWLKVKGLESLKVSRCLFSIRMIILHMIILIQITIIHLVFHPCQLALPTFSKMYHDTHLCFISWYVDKVYQFLAHSATKTLRGNRKSWEIPGGHDTVPNKRPLK